MGNTNSTDEMLRQANIKLLNFGIKWYETTKALKGTVRKKITYVAENILLNSPGIDDSKDAENKDKKTNQLYTVHFSHDQTVDVKEKAPLVVLHGHSQSASNYYAVLPVLTSNLQRHVFALDMLGCGLSTRDKWKHGYGENCDLKVAESYFVDAIEEWREKMKFEKICLVGHSMGGYISFCYAERYPERIENLTLISPVGIPDAKARDMSQAPFYVRFLFGTLRAGWSSGYSNFNVVNTIGRRWTTDLYCSSRYRPGMSWYNRDLVADQFYYNVINGNVSGGGYSHATLLKPGAYARSPLIHRFTSVFKKIPSVSFIYGESDWMDIGPAEEYRDNVEKEIADKMAVYKVNGAGHTLTIDNPIGTAEAIYRSVNEMNRGATQTRDIGLVPLMYDIGIEDKLLPGMRIEGQIGRWKNDHWREGKVMEFNEKHGTCKIKWLNEGTVTSHFPAYRIRIPGEADKQESDAGNSEQRRSSSSL